MNASQNMISANRPASVYGPCAFGMELEATLGRSVIRAREAAPTLFDEEGTGDDDAA